VPALGVDIGGVIVDRVAEDSDTSFFGTRPLETPQVPGAFEALAMLTGMIFIGRVHIISKAGPSVAANARSWLTHNRFFERSGIVPTNLHFVRERADKADVCRRVGVTHFVDDELEVLIDLRDVPNRYLFVGGLGKNPPPSTYPSWATVAANWSDLVNLLTTSVMC
jgi:hypothetical protein